MYTCTMCHGNEPFCVQALYRQQEALSSVTSVFVSFSPVMAADTAKDLAFGRINPRVPPPVPWSHIPYPLDSPLPDDKSQWYKLSAHLTSNSAPYAFHDNVIARLPSACFDSVASVVQTGVSLAMLPEMGLVDTIKEVLRELVGNTTLPNQPGEIDVRLIYGHALNVLESDEKTQPELHAEYCTNLSLWLDYITTIPLRLQANRLILPRHPHYINPLPPQRPPADTRTPLEIAAQSIASSGLPPQAVHSSSELIRSYPTLPLSELAKLAVTTAYSVPCLSGHTVKDDVWAHQHNYMKLGVSFGSEYLMRTVLWCVSMFWAAMVWRGACAVCCKRLGSWNSHHWLEQIPYSLKNEVTVAKAIDQWNRRKGYRLLSVLQNTALNCTTGQTCCGSPAILATRFGCVLPRQAARWPQPGSDTLETAEHIEYMHKQLALSASPPTRSASSSPSVGQRRQRNDDILADGGVMADDNQLADVGHVDSTSCCCLC